MFPLSQHHLVGSREGLLLLRNNRPQYPLLIVKGNKKGQRSGKLYLEAIWKDLLRAGWIFKLPQQMNNRYLTNR